MRHLERQKKIKIILTKKKAKIETNTINNNVFNLKQNTSIIYFQQKKAKNKCWLFH